jgi:hypothetical protein
METQGSVEHSSWKHLRTTWLWNTRRIVCSNLFTKNERNTFLEIDASQPDQNEKAPDRSGALLVSCRRRGLETAHATHTTAHATTRHRRSSFLPRSLGHHGFGGDQQTSHGRCILQSRAHDLGRIDDTESAARLVEPETGMDRELERLLARAGQLGSAAKPILEINPRHDLIVALADLGDAEQTLREDAAHLLLDEARILDGELPADARAFSQRLARVMRRSLP